MRGDCHCLCLYRGHFHIWISNSVVVGVSSPHTSSVAVGPPDYSSSWPTTSMDKASLVPRLLGMRLGQSYLLSWDGGRLPLKACSFRGPRIATVSLYHSHYRVLFFVIDCYILLQLHGDELHTCTILAVLCVLSVHYIWHRCLSQHYPTAGSVTMETSI